MVETKPLKYREGHLTGANTQMRDSARKKVSMPSSCSSPEWYHSYFPVQCCSFSQASKSSHGKEEMEINCNTVLHCNRQKYQQYSIEHEMGRAVMEEMGRIRSVSGNTKVFLLS